MSDKNSKQSKTVIVTGASSGLGYHIAKVLAKDDSVSRVIGIARRGEKLAELAAISEVFVPLTLDLQEDEIWNEVQSLIDPESELWIVNNAGVLDSSSFAQIDKQAFLDTFLTNVYAQFAMIRAAIPHFDRTHAGGVIAISSTLGVESVPDVPLYVASKHAVEGLMKSLRDDMFGTRVKVITIRVDDMDTELWGGQMPYPDRAIDPREVAEFLTEVISSTKESMYPETVTFKGLVRSID